MIVHVRNQQVIIDADVAKLYGVETKRINEAVRNNPDKFPADYMFVLTADESKFLRSKFSSLEHGGKGRHSKYNYKAFTEKGLYMLATVLKSRRATEATFAIIETFAIAWRRGFQPRPLPMRWSFQLRHNGAARRRTSLRRHLLQYVTWRAVGGAAVFPCILCIPWF